MRHNAIAAHGGHWGASTNGLGTVLVQLQDASAEQVRVPLNPDEALRFAEQLAAAAVRAKRERWQMEAVGQRATAEGLLEPAPSAAVDERLRVARYATAVQALPDEAVDEARASVQAPEAPVPSEKALCAALRAAVMGWDDALECMELAGMHADSNYVGAKASFRRFSEQHSAPVQQAQEAGAAELAASRGPRNPVRGFLRRAARAPKTE